MFTKVCLMTACPVTKGHEALIRFMSNFDNESGVVILSLRSFEPWVNERKIAILNIASKMHNMSFYLHEDDNAPQEPKGDDDTEFWQYWRNVLKTARVVDGCRVFSSEPYGDKIAAVMNGTHIYFGCDSIINTKATKVRSNYPNKSSWDCLAAPMQKLLHKNFVFFGAESCGKTTSACNLAYWHLDCRYIPEWARTFLEHVGPELSENRMHDIFNGQMAIQKMVFDDYSAINSWDTDIFSTIGYFRIYGIGDSLTRSMIEDAKRYKADMYFIMDTDIPFEPDQLRYGGNVRESNTDFWISLAKEFGLPYTVISGDSVSERSRKIANKVHEMLDTDNIRSFRR